MIDFDDFDDFDIDEPHDTDFENEDDNLSDDNLNRPLRTTFGKRLRMRMRLEKLKLKYADKANRRLMKVDKVKAKKGGKITAIVTFALLVLKGMMELHEDKLDKEERKEAVELARKEGVPAKVAEQISSMSPKQLAQTIHKANGTLLQKAIQSNG